MFPPSISRRLLFTAATFLLVFLVIEAGLRVLLAVRVGPDVLLYGFRATREIHNLSIHDNFVRDYSKYFPHQPRVDFDPTTKEVFSVRINAQGFRGEDFPEGKEVGVFRVVTLGASSTFGYHSQDPATYPVQLGEILRERCPGTRFEVLNLGIPHLDSSQIASLLEHEALPLQPDLVTFYEGVNDCSHRRDRHSVRRRLRRFVWLRGAFREARDRTVLVGLLDSMVHPRPRTYSSEDAAAHAAGRPERFVENLERMRAACGEQGVPFLVIAQMARSLRYPAREMRGLRYAEEERRLRRHLREGGQLTAGELYFLTHTDLSRALRSWVAEEGIPFVDGVAALDDRRDTLLSWVHLSPEGNRILAEAIAPAVLEMGCPE